MSIIQYCLDNTAEKTLLIRNSNFTSHIQAELNYKKKRDIHEKFEKVSFKFISDKHCLYILVCTFMPVSYTMYLSNSNSHFYIMKYVGKTLRSLKANAILKSYVGILWHHSVATLYIFLKLSFADQTFEKNVFFCKQLKLLLHYTYY